MRKKRNLLLGAMMLLALCASCISEPSNESKKFKIVRKGLFDFQVIPSEPLVPKTTPMYHLDRESIEIRQKLNESTRKAKEALSSPKLKSVIQSPSVFKPPINTPVSRANQQK